MGVSTTLVADRYRIEEKLGQGGMGTVYRAHDTQTDVDVAVKHLKRDIVGDDHDTIERFQREAVLLRELNHPNIVHLQDIIERSGEYYLVLEYVPGGSLSDLLHMQDSLSIERALQIALDLSDALTRAHRLGVIHRDIKPSNVLLAADGTPRLSDFGIAHSATGENITRTGTLLGTAAYLAPEAFKTEQVNERSDIWSFGVMLYQMLTGRLPFDNRQPLPVLITSILNQPVPDITTLRPDVPQGLSDLLYQMLSKDPEQRIGSVRQVGAIVETLISGTPITPIRLSQTMAALDPDADDTSPTLRVTTTSMTESVSIVQNAPATATRFIGRTEDVQEIVKMVRRGDVRLLSITGPGGVGKSRLGLRVAQELAEDFPDGAFFVPLAMVSEPRYAKQSVAAALNLDFVGNEPPLVQLKNFLREKRLLLVLDNFEHLMAAAPDIAQTLAAAPGVVVIVTTRERLNLQDEWVHPLEGMHVPDPDTANTAEIASALDKYEAVQLFAEVARRTKPDFDLQGELRHVLRILRLVDGSPLAIQLATAWLSVLPLDEIATEIEDSFDFLETRLRDMPERHRSLRAVFEYSWNTLEEHERNTLRDLTIFMSGFTRGSAKIVTQASLRTLTSLADKSLINVGKGGHYWLHSMVRAYARQQLEANADRLNELEKQLVGYATSLLRQHFKNESEDRDNERDFLISIWGNLREAWRIATQRSMTDAVDEMTFPLWYMLETRNLNEEGIEAFSMAAEHCTAAPHLNTKLTLVRAWFMMRNGDYDGAFALATEGMHGVAESTDSELTGFANNIISYILYRRGDFAQALNFAELAVEGFRESYLWWGLGLGLGNIGYIHLMRGDYAAARAALEEGYRMAQNNGFSFAIGYAANNLGEVLVKQGELDEAERLFKEAAKAFTKIEYRPGKAFVYGNLGDVARLKRDFSAEAYNCYDRGLQIYQEVGDQNGVATMLVKRGQFALAAGAYEEAHYQLEHGLLIYRNIGRPSGVALALYLLGETAYVLDDTRRAGAYFMETLGVACDSDSERQQLEALLGLASLMAEDANFIDATRLLTLVHAHPATEFDTRQRAARTLEALQDRMDANAYRAATTAGHNTTLTAEVGALLAG
jgi:serine/threonine protein kinase/predicted ATPase/Flp pilus assembly protein TadD